MEKLNEKIDYFMIFAAFIVALLFTAKVISLVLRQHINFRMRMALDFKTVGQNNNIKEINNDFFNNVDLINFRECDYCIARNICGGACVNENFYATGNINIPSKKHCNYTRSVVEKLLEIYLTLDEKDKEYLFS